jgi:hypothetical protein
MTKIEISKELAKEIYEESPNFFKRILQETFKGENLGKKDWKELRTFNDCCISCGTTEKQFDDKWKDIPVSDMIITVAKFEIMNEAINQGWMPDTLNTNQQKWYPRFMVSSSGLDFLTSDCDCDDAIAIVGFPFCFETEEKAIFAGKTFIKLWEKLLLRK